MSHIEIAKFLVAMIVMMNPLGSLSIFLDLTKHYSESAQTRTARRCGLAVIISTILTIWLGENILDALGITIAAFRFAGGLILIIMGYSMLQSKDSPVSHTPEDDEAALERDSIAIVPMAMPTIIGPGAISTLIIAANDYPSIASKSILTLVTVALGFVMWMMLHYGAQIARFVGPSVIKVITRLMGMIVMSLAVGMLASGLTGLIPALVK